MLGSSRPVTRRPEIREAPCTTTLRSSNHDIPTAISSSTSWVSVVPLAAAVFAIAQESWTWLALYLGWLLVHMVVVYRVLCTHCPHYGAEDGVTSCHFIAKVPMLFKRREGPLKPVSMVVLMLMLSFSSLAPVPWLLRHPDLMVLYFLSLGVLFATMMKYECTRCKNFNCPKNQVPKDLRSTLPTVE
jgi:hypothetical protein